MTAAEPNREKADPTQVHEAAKWKYARPLTACRVDPQGRYAFTGAEDYLVQRWSIADGTLTEMAGHESWVRSLGCTPDGKVLASGGYDGKLILWPVAADKPEPLRKIDAHNGWLRALAISPNGEFVATCGNDQLVKLWNIADGKLVREFTGHDWHVYNVAFHPNGQDLVSFDLKGIIKHWKLDSGKLEREFTAAALYKYDTTFRADIGGARSLAFTPDGKLLAAGGMTNCTNAFAGIGNPAVVAIDWESGQVKTQHGGKEKINGMMWGLAPHADGYWVGLSGGGGGGMLYFWKPGEVDEFFRFKLPDTGRDMALFADGLQVAVVHFDQHLRVYRLAKKA